MTSCMAAGTPYLGSLVLVILIILVIVVTVTFVIVAVTLPLARCQSCALNPGGILLLALLIFFTRLI